MPGVSGHCALVADLVEQCAFRTVTRFDAPRPFVVESFEHMRQEDKESLGLAICAIDDHLFEAVRRLQSPADEQESQALAETFRTIRTLLRCTDAVRGRLACAAHSLMAAIGRGLRAIEEGVSDRAFEIWCSA